MKISKPNEPFDFSKKAIICETEEEAKLLLEIATLRGYKWKSGKSFNDHTAWYNHDTRGLAYYINLGQYGAVNLIESKYKAVFFKDIKEQLKK